MPRIPRAIIDEMVAHAREDLPNEACGVVHATDGVPTSVHRIANVANETPGQPPSGSPYRYLMHPMQFARLEQRRDSTGETLFSIYHSHVASEARPSPTDVRSAFFPPGQVTERPMYPEAYYIVISLARKEGEVIVSEDPPVVRAWRIVSASTVDEAIRAMQEEPIEVV
ncbi:MAG: M67 family peptidase [Chloroflexi bacterium]|nr:MAG: M67 family peptidase [Chloroflexota bacterium]